MWTGRLAYEDPEWTLTSGPAHEPRTARTLVPALADIPLIVATAHHAIDTLEPAADAEHDQAQSAAKDDRLLVPEEEAANKAGADAARRGWAPPQARDDDQIDLPEGQPEKGWKPSGRTTKLAVDLVEDSDFVRQNDGYRLASAREVTTRLGVSRACLEQAYVRARRYVGDPGHAELSGRPACALLP